jgi:tetratricopeptide (TPR) repeat protein
VLTRAGDQARDLEEAVGLLLEAARLIHTRVGDVEGSIQIYRRVLDRDPHNAAAAAGLAEAARNGLEPEVVCARYRATLETDPANLIVAREWAEVAFTHSRLDDLRYLFDVLYARAGGSAGVPDTRARLREALDRFVAAQKWDEAVDVLRALGRESTGALAAKYYATAGKIAELELGQEEAAIELYGHSLDADPADTRTFERIYSLLSARRAWAEAETEVRRMIDRLRAAGKGDDAEVMIPMWRRLGDVRRTGTRNMAAATEAYRECARLAPEDRYAKMVAELTARQHSNPQTQQRRPH